MTSISKAAAAALATAVVAAGVLLVVGMDGPEGANPSIPLLWVVVVLVYSSPVAIAAYVIVLLRNIAADGRASRCELEATRRELEQMRCHLARERIER